MSCESIFKDVIHIHARLFDHRSAFQGHINYFVKEFEEKRGDREKIRLDRIQEVLTQSKDQTLPEIHKTFSDHLQAIKEKVAQAEQSCRHILDTETNRKSDFLESQREQRQHDMAQFMQQQCIKSARIDQQFVENVKLFNSASEELKQNIKDGISLSDQAYYKFMALGKQVVG